jgi:hypothetical protein
MPIQIPNSHTTKLPQQCLADSESSVTTSRQVVVSPWSLLLMLMGSSADLTCSNSLVPQWFVLAWHVVT